MVPPGIAIKFMQVEDNPPLENKCLPSVTVWVCKRFEFVIRSESNLKTAASIVNQSENGYGWNNYTDC